MYCESKNDANVYKYGAVTYQLFRIILPIKIGISKM
jgi:hypothetical protein